MGTENFSIRDKAKVPELDLQKMREDSSHMEPERCCGNCCWFCFEDTDGDGQCFDNELPFADRYCGFEGCERYVSREEKRHYMAVLLQANRYRRDKNVPSIYKMPNPTELGKAIDFSVRYLKVFSRL